MKLGDSVSLQVVASDPEGRLLSYVAYDLPPGLSIDAVTGLISGTTTQAGNYFVNVAAIDDIGNSASISFNWTVNEAPTGILPLTVCWIANPNSNTSAWQVTNPNPVPLIPGQPDKAMFDWQVLDADGNVLQSAQRWEQRGTTRINTVLAERIVVTWYLFNNQVGAPLGTVTAIAEVDTCGTP